MTPFLRSAQRSDPSIPITSLGLKAKRSLPKAVTVFFVEVIGIEPTTS
jgi:hypothetical protein